ncbi:MAG: Hsp20/alpha crystallin family protein [Armatimonadetes bacterium]|nr:Hsp20/alpha crystallin family protein [Armatimonadota bacterium]
MFEKERKERPKKEKASGSEKELYEKIPRRDLMAIRSTMNEMFSDLFSGRPPRTLQSVAGWQPMVNVFETADDLIVRADLPDMEAGEIDISATTDTITIKGERKIPDELAGMELILKEQPGGTFFRTLSVPCRIKETEIKASYRNGVLEIRVPKSNEKGKSIQIDAE